MKYIITVEGKTFEIEVGQGQVWVDQRPYDVDFQDVDGLAQYSLLVDHRSYEAHVERIAGDVCRMTMDGRPYQARLHRGGNGKGVNAEPNRARSTTQAEVRAPLPGLLVEMCVSEGERVQEQDVVAVMESMKMNLELRAPRSGVVRDLRIGPGHEVARGDVLAVVKVEG